MRKLSLACQIFVVTVMLACNKSSFTNPTSTFFNVTNAVVGGTTLSLNTTAMTVGSNAFAQFPLLSGQTMVNLFPASTPSSPYYDQTIATDDKSNYSLFLSGPSSTAIDAILIKESYSNYTDSLCGVRFINLSPNSNAISINITGQSNGSEVARLPYKAYSGFKSYTAKSTNKTYAFQVRDAVTGNLITSYSLTTPYFNNVTIVLRGLITSPGILLVKNY